MGLLGEGNRKRMGAGREVVAIGLRRQPGKDLYHSLLTASWRRLFVLVTVAYVCSNAMFAAGYLLEGDVIENARPGSFLDAFFFSVQTMATIGYGKMAPRTTLANALVATEALVGMMGLAVVTGLVFAKFSRPTARVLFSRVAVVAPYDGVPSLLFRMANERASQIVEAQLHAVVLRDETTAEGEPVRRAHDLHLRRSRSAVFALTWTAIHPITPDSPLHGEDAASLAAKRTDLIVSLTGFDESLSQNVHARRGYGPSDIRWGSRFEDILGQLPDGRQAIDYRKFHDVVPVEPARAVGPAPAGRRGSA